MGAREAKPPLPKLEAEAEKPTLRGVKHQWAAVYAAGAGTGLVALAPNATARLAVAIYAASLFLLLTVSALYHRVHWSPEVRMWLRRADHAAIFLLIGGTYTPFALLALGGEAGRHLLLTSWSAVAAGILVSLLWPGAPKFVSAAIAVVAGWSIVPHLGAVAAALSTPQLWLTVLGGIAYTVGAVVYAAKWPNPRPGHFGYHEVFHLLTLVGAGLHLAAVFSIVAAIGR